MAPLFFCASQFDELGDNKLSTDLTDKRGVHDDGHLAMSFSKRVPSAGLRATTLPESGAISWDGSFDWPKRSDATNKTRPNDAPTLPLSPKPRREETLAGV